MKDADLAKAGRVSDLRAVARDPLVERVASASAFGKSNRLRELFLFLCERSLGNPGGVLHEQEIGVAVFGRRPDYDTAQDAIVRVQVSQLRKRLEQYFASEGLDEPVIIEIPKGSYTPVLRNREPKDKVEAPAPRRPFFAIRPRMWVPVLAGIALVLLAADVLFRLSPPAVQTGPVFDPGPTVNRLWSQMFERGRPVCLVLSDANLGLFEDITHHQFSLNEYRDKDFTRLGLALIPDPVERARQIQAVGYYFTHTSDARLAATFAALNAVRNLSTEVVFAQDFGVSYLQSHNLILLGTRRTNPWLELFESQLNFRTVFQETPMLSLFRNTAPQPGESAEYAVLWRTRGYCRVAFLPIPSRTGNALLVSGTDMASTEAGGQFISSERWIRTLSTALNLSRNAPFPHFEVLLKVDYMTWNTPKFELAAHRIYK